MADSSIPVDANLLRVPNTAAHGHYIAEPRSAGLRSRSSSPGSSRAASPTLASVSLSPTPLISGGPYSRHSFASSSAVSLCQSAFSTSGRYSRQCQSSFELGTYGRNSSSFNICIEGDNRTGLSEDIAEHEPATAPPQEGEDTNDTILLEPISPSMMEDHKYTRRPIPQDYAYISDIPSETLEFLHHQNTPDGWVRCVAPEGNVYYHDMDRRIYTVSDVNDEKVVAWIDRSYQILKRKQDRSRTLDDIDFALCYETSGYYLTSWKLKVIFWLEGVNVWFMTQGIRKPLSNVHLGYKVRSEFWYVSNSYRLSQDCVDELRSMLTFGHADFISSETTTFPYDSETAVQLLRLVDKLQVDKEGAVNAYYISTLARFLDQLNSERFLHYHGEPHARLNRIDSVHEKDTSSRSYLFIIMSPFLFYQPSWYFNELQKVYVDETVHYYAWRRFIGELKKDWESSLTPATVLLSANVGFLAIQSVDNTTSHVRSLAQIASYVSALFSLFDYVVVQLLMRRHRLSLYDTAERGFEYLSNRNDTLGLQMTAICVSLPGALFVWSILTFLLALAFIFFHNSTSATVFTTAFVAVVLSLMVFNLFLVDLFGDTIKSFPQLPQLPKMPERLKSCWSGVRNLGRGRWWKKKTAASPLPK